jgi:hypothetical protein
VSSSAEPRTVTVQGLGTLTWQWRLDCWSGRLACDLGDIELRIHGKDEDLAAAARLAGTVRQRGLRGILAHRVPVFRKAWLEHAAYQKHGSTTAADGLLGGLRMRRESRALGSDEQILAQLAIDHLSLVMSVPAIALWVTHPHVFGQPDLIGLDSELGEIDLEQSDEIRLALRFT